MTNHYIVAGDTAAADHVARELVQTGRQVVMVTPDGAEAGRRRTIPSPH